MKPVADIVPATGAFPSRVQQAAVLIKTGGPGCAGLIPGLRFAGCRGFAT
jgi:hypothetical protein